MTRTLQEIKIDFTQILLLEDELSSEQKARKYASLMTELECNYKIPILQNDKFDFDNQELMYVYRLISNARTFLWEE